MGIHYGDRPYLDDPPAGDPKCVCSRCGQRIYGDQEPVRFYVEKGVQYRYHAVCIGIPMDPPP